MTTYSVNAQAVQDFLNRLSILSTKDKAVGMLQPQPLELAVAQFCAYEIYSWKHWDCSTATPAPAPRCGLRWRTTACSREV